MPSIISVNEKETEDFGERIAKKLKAGDVVALYGGLGMGKTAFARGLARGLSITEHVSSPTFALVHDYGGNPPLIHFDMYRVSEWEDLYTTGFFDYIESGSIVVVEWSENIEEALPEKIYRIYFSKLSDVFKSEGISDNHRLIKWTVPKDIDSI